MTENELHLIYSLKKMIEHASVMRNRYKEQCDRIECALDIRWATDLICEIENNSAKTTACPPHEFFQGTFKCGKCGMQVSA